MLGLNDKFNVCIVNAYDIDGKVYPVNISLPTDNIKIPNKVVDVSVFEYTEGTAIGGNEVFRILIGERTTIRDFFHFKKGYKPDKLPDFEFKDRLGKIKDVDQEVCYIKDKNGKCIIYSIVRENDIVVKDKEEMEKTIMNISDEIANIKDSIKRVRRLEL